MDFPRLEDLGDLDGRRVLVRCDFNVPLANGVITDDLRIRAAVPTLRYLLDAGAHVTACSHLGRPRGAPDPAWSVEPVRARLADLAPGVDLLENLRFDPGETADDPSFVAQLVAGRDAYVNDAFGASHRAHASVVGPPRHLPSAAGRLLAREVEVLGGLRTSARRPFVGILGGAKVSDKLGVIKALLGVVDELIVGGAMCFTFLAAKGANVGSSLLEEDLIGECARLLDSGAPIRLPLDITALGPGGRIGDPSAGGEVRQVGTSMPDGWMGLDIGPGSAVEFCDLIAEARTVLWNGPMGVSEWKSFSKGTARMAETLSNLAYTTTVIGGGSTAEAVAMFGFADGMTHVSTGGGASIEFLEGKTLPGVAALMPATDQ